MEVDLRETNQKNKNMQEKDFLIISETFYSIQGEGACIGAPAVFLRLAGCNLRCPGFSYKDPETGEHLGCDTKLVWVKGDRHKLENLLAQWQKNGWLEKLNQGAHLIITGGEPLLQQPGLVAFLKLLDQKTTTKVMIEMETNGSFAIEPEILHRINQFNVSPKLTNSGETREKAYNPAVLKTLAESNKAVFKFVVANKNDIHEITSQYVKPFAIPSPKIWLMPEGGTKKSINEKKSWLIELCKEYAMNFTTRLHIDIWDEATGV